jgi:hypothetical protein
MPGVQMMADSAARGFQLKPRHCTFATFLVCLAIIPICNSYPTSVWPLETVAKSASVFATVKVGHVIPPASQPESVYRTVPGHVELVVLRSFPQSAMKADEHIELDFETLPAGNSGMNGPDVAYFEEGMILIVPLKPNPRPATDAWRLFADVGGGIVIPAIERSPTFPGHAKSGREYLLQEVASALSGGTREEVLKEASYLSGQTTNEFAADLMQSLIPAVNRDTERWGLISASLVSSLGIPRPTIADFSASKYGTNPASWRGSLVEALVQKALSSRDGKEKLIHQFLDISDLATWGPGITLQEFAQERSLVQELGLMLESRRPGALYTAYDVLKAGQNKIRAAAVVAALAYVNDPSKNHSEIQAACWVIRDFGTEAQFNQLVRAIRKYQYEEPKQYDEIWRNTIWSDNDRERAVLEILLADQRMYDASQRYSDIARNELARLSKPTPSGTQ